MRYLAEGAGSSVLLTPSAAVLELSRGRGSARQALALQFPGSRHPRLIAEQRLPGRVNYFLGRDRSLWHTGVPTFAGVRYAHVWPGIDASFYGNNSRLEYDLRVAPNADPGRIALRFVGARRARIDSSGALTLTLSGGRTVRELAPFAYQRVNGSRRAVQSHYVLSAGVARIALGRYDHSRALTVDPLLDYTTYFGGGAFGSGGRDSGNDIAIDAEHNAYITGNTVSQDLPTTPGVNQRSCGGGCGGDAFVTKLNPTGTAVVYSTYIGGDGEDFGSGIAVDSQGSAYVAGGTRVPATKEGGETIFKQDNFPTTGGAFRQSCADSVPEHPGACPEGDAFVTKLSRDGSSLVYSTYLGGNSRDIVEFEFPFEPSESFQIESNERGETNALKIAVDKAGAAYVAGTTYSTNFPTSTGHPCEDEGEGCEHGDAFVTKVKPDGSGLEYSTYLGGKAVDVGTGVAVDESGDAYASGWTFSTDVLKGAYPTNAGSSDAFVRKLSTTGVEISSTYFGGSGFDAAEGVAVDSAGNVYLTGFTFSPPEFPQQKPGGSACGAAGCGHGDAFVAKLDTALSTLDYSTYLGGSRLDIGEALAVDPAGNAYLTGVTYSLTDFPIRNAVQEIPGAGEEPDAFVAKLNSAGTGLVYATFLGGVGGDRGNGIAVDASGDAFISGFTQSVDLPLTPGAAQPSCGDQFCVEGDAFVARVPYDVTPPSSTASVPACRGPATVSVADDPGGRGPRAVQFTIDRGPPQTVGVAGNPATVALPIPEGNHVLGYRGEDAAGNREPFHSVAVQVDTTPPTLAIRSDQDSLAYEVGQPASVSIAAADATSGLASDPSTSHLQLSTARPGRFTLKRSATDHCGNTAVASFTDTVVLHPVLAVSVLVEPVRGTIRVGKGGTFTALTEPRTIPVGSLVDAGHGTARITTATVNSGQFQSGEFTAGVFSVLQRRSQQGLAELRLIDPRHNLCARAGKASVARKPSRRVLALLRGDSHGRFSTRGRYSAATVRGTAWRIEDRCDGTLTVVTRGTVVVRDFRLRRSIRVRAGKSYLAKAR